jgi:hypothetical protein
MTFSQRGKRHVLYAPIRQEPKLHRNLPSAISGRPPQYRRLAAAFGSPRAASSSIPLADGSASPRFRATERVSFSSRGGSFSLKRPSARLPLQDAESAVEK